MKKTKFVEAIREAKIYLLDRYPKVFVIGQGVWSPWYVGNSMLELDRIYGRARIIDTPVSEAACTGLAVGAALCGYRPIVVHPRMDFAVLASDPIVNSAAKWSYMFGKQSHAGVTIRAIINRGGEQGAQHSQALHSWYAHIPGLRVVMPATPADARDLLIASVLCDDPVVYIDDRWLYDIEEEMPDVTELSLANIGPVVRRPGSDVTLVGAGWTAHLAKSAAGRLAEAGISAEVVDVRVLNPFDPTPIVKSVSKTGRLLAIDGGWRTCGFASEIVAAVSENLESQAWQAPPKRISLPDAPAPSSRPLEEEYYPTVNMVIDAVRGMMHHSARSDKVGPRAAS